MLMVQIKLSFSSLFVKIHRKLKQLQKKINFFEDL